MKKRTNGEFDLKKTGAVEILEKNKKKKRRVRLSTVLAVVVAMTTVGTLVLPARTLTATAPDPVPEPIAAEQTVDVTTSTDSTVNADALSATMPAQQFADQMDTLDIAVSADDGAFPADTTMQLVPAEDLNALFDEAAATVQARLGTDIQYMEAIDIGFYNNGNEVQPQQPVRVTISSDNIADKPSPVILHRSADGLVNIVAPAVLAADEGRDSSGRNDNAGQDDSALIDVNEENEESVTLAANQIAFDAGQFSVYMLAYPVQQIAQEDILDAANAGAFRPADAMENRVDEEYSADDVGEGPSDSVESVVDDAVVDADDTQLNINEENEQTAVGADEAAQADTVEQGVDSEADGASVEAADNDAVVDGVVNDADRAEDSNPVNVDNNAVDADEPASAPEQDADTDKTDSDSEKTTQDDSEKSSAEKAGSESIQTALKNTISKLSIDTITADGENYTVTVAYTDAARIPDGAKLEAKEIKAGSREYDNYLQKAGSLVEQSGNRESVVGTAGSAAEQNNTDDDQTVDSDLTARFFDISIIVDGQEIEPAAPVSVRISHDGAEETEGKTAHAVHFIDGENAVLVDHVRSIADDEALSTVSFPADSFSVYGIVYTVDFHWVVDGKEYDFSIPGGGFISLTDLVEKLGIVSDVNDGQSGDAAAIEKNNDETSEDAAAFVKNVEKVEFSDPGLVWIGKVDADTTVGALKDANSLACEYSADMTDDQIAEINAQTVKAGDWALISLKPFDTEESLTVTMKDGDQIKVSVTDRKDEDSSAFDGTTKMVLWAQANGKYYALKSNGRTEEIALNNIDRLGEEFLWTVTYGWKHSDGKDRYYIRPVSDPSKSINFSWDTETLIGDQCGLTITDKSGGYVIGGWSNSVLYLKSDNTGIRFAAIAKDNQAYNGYYDGIATPVHFSSQTTGNLTYNYTVKTTDPVMGLVKSGNGATVESLSESTNNSKQNTTAITAVPNGPIDKQGHQKYLFDYWDLNGTTLTYASGNNLPAVIDQGKITFPYDGYELTAHFKRNPQYVETDPNAKVGREFSDEEKAELDNWLSQLQSRAVPLDVSGTKKTAELYDYENRIYRVDITAQSNLETFDGAIDLGFILDMSGSMQFPAELKEVTTVESYQTSDGWYVRKNVQTSDNTDLRRDYNWEQNYWGKIEVSNSDGQVLIGRLNDNDTTKQILNRNKTYYYVADRAGTFTVYHMKYDWSQDRGSDAWVSSDASAGNYGRLGWGGYNRSNDPLGMYYTLYEASDNGSYTKNAPTLANKDTNRKWYLENSLNNTIKDCNTILRKISIAKGDTDNKNPDVEIAYNTFFKKVDKKEYNFSSTTNITDNLSFDTSGGTGTDFALLNAAGKKYDNDVMNNPDKKRSSYSKPNYTSSGDNPAGFKWNSDKRYVILITDGAPQSDGVAVNDQYVKDAANELKKQNVELITVGLSMKDVKRGSILLYDIASRDDSGEPLFFAAEGNDLQYVLYDIVRTIMQKAIVEGEVNDTVNEAFYPVDKATGKPLTNGDKIDLDGNLITGTPEGAYGIVSEDDGVFTVKWTGQDFTWDGWHGTFYQKAKEDFLGGNAVKTNEGKATVNATGYKFTPGGKVTKIDQTGKNVSEANRKKELDTPRVNVNDLNFTQNDTEWTVYLGTEVSPEEQLAQLLKNVLVEETVTAAQDKDTDGLPDTLTNSAGMYYPLLESDSDGRESEASGERLTFPLWELLKKLDNDNRADEVYLADLIDRIISSGTNGLIYKYDLYGTSDSPGSITIKLTKSGETADYETHVTTKTVAPAETYTLDITFAPDYDHIPVGQGGNAETAYEYNTGAYGLGTYGNAAGEDYSNNSHKINVFAKKLKLIKVDQTQTKITNSEAKFGLYRKATAEDSATAKTTPPGLTGDYILVQELDTVNGIVTTEPIASIKKNEPYYLVETKAPDGYNKLAEPLLVTVDMTGHNTWTKLSDNTTSQTKPDPYALSNWLQEVAIKVTDSDGNACSNAVLVDNRITYDHKNDTTDASIKYKIVNDAGAELPATGGIGTTLFYLLGGALAVTAGTVLIVRKRRKTA